MVHKLLMALVGTYGGRECRRCATPLDRRDAFSMSEGVCGSCVA